MHIVYGSDTLIITFFGLALAAIKELISEYHHHYEVIVMLQHPMGKFNHLNIFYTDTPGDVYYQHRYCNILRNAPALSYGTKRQLLPFFCKTVKLFSISIHQKVRKRNRPFNQMKAYG